MQKKKLKTHPEFGVNAPCVSVRFSAIIVLKLWSTLRSVPVKYRQGARSFKNKNGVIVNEKKKAFDSYCDLVAGNVYDGDCLCRLQAEERGGYGRIQYNDLYGS